MLFSKALRGPACSNCRSSLLRTFTSLAADSAGASILPKTQQSPRKPIYTYKQTRVLSTNTAAEGDHPREEPGEIGRDTIGFETKQSRVSSAVTPAEDSDPHDEPREIGGDATELETKQTLVFSTDTPVEDNKARDTSGEEDNHPNDESGEISGETTELETKETLPWYLQVDTVTKTPEFFQERQRIPDLPDNPPEILEPVLQQLSVDLGLDYLSILDLRKLDPPAALGANLLMIIGTARSEKHLHTSADRFCRWLRSTYKLRPDADGLLGRDERKLKMKRKARRAKLLGNGMEDDGDDGIRTGWICVNVGVVEKAPEAGQTAGLKNFVGFGQRFNGVKLVVQMLTEEKREEIDLESLWNGIIRGAENMDNFAEGTRYITQ